MYQQQSQQSYLMDNPSNVTTIQPQNPNVCITQMPIPPASRPDMSYAQQPHAGMYYGQQQRFPMGMHPTHMQTAGGPMQRPIGAGYPGGFRGPPLPSMQNERLVNFTNFNPRSISETSPSWHAAFEKLNEHNTVALCKLGRDLTNEICTRINEFISSLRAELLQLQGVPPQQPSLLPFSLTMQDGLIIRHQKTLDSMKTLRSFMENLEIIYKKIADEKQKLLEQGFTTDLKALIPFADEENKELIRIQEETKQSETYKNAEKRLEATKAKLDERQKELKEIMEFTRDLHCELSFMLENKQQE